MKTIKQLRLLQKAYQKMRDMWRKSNDPNKLDILYEFNVSIMEIDEEIRLIELINEDTYYAM